MAMIIEDNNVENVEVTTATPTNVAAPIVNPEILGSQTKNLHFMGTLGNNKTMAEAVVRGEKVPRPKTVGYAFKWTGEEALEVYADRLVQRNPKKTLLTTSAHPEKVQIQPGEVFYLTLAATAELLGRPEFNSHAEGGVISETLKSPQSVRLVLNNKAVKDNPFEIGIALKHVSRTKPGEPSQAQPIKEFPIHLFDKVGADGKASDDAKLKPEFAEIFGALVASRSTTTGKDGQKVSINKDAIELSALFNKLNG